jgi:hypothetical protein
VTNDSQNPLQNLRPAVVQCLGAHILATNWLAGYLAASDTGVDEAVRKQMLREAMTQATMQYAAMPVEELAELLKRHYALWAEVHITVTGELPGLR